MTKCFGCGAFLQNIDKNSEGYVKNLNNKFCERCFKITHYNEYIYNDKSNEEYLKKIDYINKTKDLVILTVDFLNMIDLDSIYLSNPILLIFTKKDILPRNVNESKFLSKIKCNLNIKNKFFVSSKNNYNLDLLYENINKYRTGKNVYVVGLTNAGKSTLINKMLKNYSDIDYKITTSNLPSTTLDFIEKEFEDFNLIDTPGLLDEGNIINYVSSDLIKKIIPKKEIHPIIYQIKCDQTIVIEDIIRLDVPVNNIVLYISNSLNIRRIYKDTDILSNYGGKTIKIDDNKDLVIKGLGFINFKNKCSFKIFINDNIEYFIRNSIV